MQRLLLAAALAAAPACAFAHDGPRATDHAPIGVMADHTHNKGEWMLGYRYMRSEMGGMRLDGDAISPEQVAVIANPYAPPATLRTVPLSGAMDMHMFGVMWAPSDRLTLMASGNYAERNMRSVVFAGPAGTTRLAETTGSSNGFGGIRLSTLWDLRSSDTSRLVLAVGAPVPTGSIDKTARMLTPMNTTMEMVMPYGMQMGSGTVDPFASLTWAAEAGRVSWGAQGRATLRLYDNDRDYRLGDEAAVTAWAGYSPAP